MKRFAFACLLVFASFNAYSIEDKDIDRAKLNGPGCMRYLNRNLKFKFSESYQICSMKGEDVKACLIKKNKKSDCFKK